MERVLANNVLLQEILGKLTYPADLSAARGVSRLWRAACKDHQQIVCGTGFNPLFRPYDSFDLDDDLSSDADILALCKELQRCRHTVRVLLVQMQYNNRSLVEDRRLYGIISMLFGLQALSLLGADLGRVHVAFLPNSLQQLELEVQNEAALPLEHMHVLRTLFLCVFFDWDANDDIKLYLQLPHSLDRFDLRCTCLSTETRRFLSCKVTVVTVCTKAGICTLEEYLKSVNVDMSIHVQVDSPLTLQWTGLDSAEFARQMSYVGSAEEDST